MYKCKSYSNVRQQNDGGINKSKTQEQIQLNSTQLREMKEQQNETTAK